MNSIKHCCLSVMAAISVMGCLGFAQTPDSTYQVLYSFGAFSQDGTEPGGPVAIGAGGVLYGTTTHGGLYPGWGTVFALNPPISPGGPWTETQLFLFTGGWDGLLPFDVVLGEDGTVYCLAAGAAGGTPPATAISLTPNGNSWEEDTLYLYGLQEQPTSLYVKAGGLYGTTLLGGDSPNCKAFYGCGSIYTLTPAQGGTWNRKTLFSFPDGNYFNGPLNLLVGHDGKLYGSAQGLVPVCVGGCGSVFAITPPVGGGDWTGTAIHDFTNSSGDGTGGGALLLGKDGLLYGTTTYGGKQSSGIVFSLTPPDTPGGFWKETILYTFGGLLINGIGGVNPNRSLVMDKNGVLYGTTLAGGLGGGGIVFSLRPPRKPGGQWTERTLHLFTSAPDGLFPAAGLTMGADGTLYGTTYGGGAYGQGTVFALKP